ncbi:MAG: OmpA family protein [Burkholderiaceae bacterium]|nr:OmpA family protein [Burkholderiaceae bacterium]
MKTLLLVACLGLGLVLNSAASAQNVLKGSQVSENALIDALAIDPPEVAASGAKTRGFRPAAAGGAAPKPANPNAGKASLLITFPTNSADLTDETKGLLDMLARALQSDKLAGFAFKVEGHADARGDAERNLKLSQLRAESVANYLVASHGVLPERLTAVGKGASELMNKAQLDAPENRRVTIVTLKN